MDAEWLGYAGAVLMTSMSLPQIARIVRDRSAAGVSLLTWLVFCVSGTGWLAYGLILRAPAIIAGNVPFVSGSVCVVVLLLIRQRRWGLVPAVGTPVATVLVAVALLTHLPPMVSSGLGVLGGILTMLPQLLESVQRRRAGLVSEVSLATLGLLLAGQSLWLAYGLARPDVPIIVTNVIAVTVTSALIAVEWRSPTRRVAGH
ncbi:MAG TPA: SemiSWEET family transporter [Actinomycetota bacterium]|nr:SemiSWEET family transporter [Actinomycetota bacterium]